MAEHEQKYLIDGFEITVVATDDPASDGPEHAIIREVGDEDGETHDVYILGIDRIRAVAQRLGRFVRDLEAAKQQKVPLSRN